MAYKPRTESEALTILNVLNTRMSLSEKYHQQFFRLKRGYEGEILFDEFTEKLQSDCYILNDLLLKVNNTTFQIDSLIIISGTIYFYEVKNYEGDYLYESDTDRIYKLPKKEYNNPLLQMKRSESLLRQLLHDIGYNLPIEAHVVFINPKFTLYQAPLNKHFIFPTQVTNHIQKLDSSSSNGKGRYRSLANKLVSLHIEKSPYILLPTYEYEHLKKGMNCRLCHSFSISVYRQNCVCSDCGYVENAESAVVRMINEIKLLFPDWKITTSGILEWCKVINCRTRISRILRKNFKITGNRRWTYYE